MRPIRRAAILLLVAGGTLAMTGSADKKVPTTPTPERGIGQGGDWTVATPESFGISAARMEALWEELAKRNTHALLVIRNDRVLFERYAEGHGRTTKHYTASLAKALVGGLTLMLAMADGRIDPDDRASKHVPQWGDLPRKKEITVRHLATHTSGIEDAESDGLPHEQLPGWKGEFWKRLAPPRDPFTLARDAAPVLDLPGTRVRYSNPGMAMLAYCVTASLRGGGRARGPAPTDLRSLLRARVMEPIGVPEAEWSCGYGTTTAIEGLNLVANWGGGSYSPNAVARVGRLMLRQGTWNDRPLIPRPVVAAATTHAGTPGGRAQGPAPTGLGWWVNRTAEGTRQWPAVPEDAFWGAGAGQQFLLVVPSLDLIIVRFGDLMDRDLDFDRGLETHLVTPLMAAVTTGSVPGTRPAAPYPQSPVIREITWAPVSAIRRLAPDSDCWPATWGDDDALYTAYRDGHGFEPKVPEKLSLGIARVNGRPPDLTGQNIRSATGEATGDGARGKKASGLLMVDGVLYMWVRNAASGSGPSASQLAWSADRGKTWRWSDWKFTIAFGCPTFLNFGKDYAGARDGYVYVYSQDADTAYSPADRMVLARVPKDRILRRDAYEFFQKLDGSDRPVWTREIEQRGAVFTHPGRCYRSSVSYNSALRRYLWCQTLPGGDTRFRGGFAIYDAPEPWGPWTTVYFTEEWDTGPGETSSFPTPWMSADGKTLHLLFSGDDAFSVRQATLTLSDR